MAAKKYLSLEEAAQVLGLRSDEVIRMRERGDLRGFADRGTWKFKSDDVEEAKRRRQPDSSPDVPLIDDDSIHADEDDLGNQPTMVRGSASDSDVRLILDDNLQSKPLTGSSAELPILMGPGSDSDVRLVGKPTPAPLMGSDSDVKLLMPKGSDSGIRLSDSDSDVRLAAPGKGSDSDVKLVSSPTGLRPGVGDTFDLDAGESVLLEHDSGIHLPEGSSVKLTGSSSLRLTGADSGIRLSSPADSGILLEGPADSGIKLQPSGVSGLGLGSGLGLAEDKPKKRPNKPQTEELDVTTPLLYEPREDMKGTDPEVPMFSLEEEEDLMPKMKGQGDTHAETSVIMFDEDEDLDDVAATQLKKKPSGLSGVNFEDSSSDVETVEEYADDEEEELEVSDEILGEDDELEEMEVFDTEDSDFSDSFSEGASAADFSPRGLGKIAVAEREWTGMDVALVTASTLALTIGAMVSVDLLRTVWGAGGPMDNGPFMALFGGFFQ